MYARVCVSWGLSLKEKIDELISVGSGLCHASGAY
jgi:hypothetical protein